MSVQVVVQIMASAHTQMCSLGSGSVEDKYENPRTVMLDPGKVVLPSVLSSPVVPSRTSKAAHILYVNLLNLVYRDKSRGL